MFQVSAEWVKAHGTYEKNGEGCAWNRKQLSIIGVEWPPRKGWLREVVGRNLTEADRLKFESYRLTSKKLRPSQEKLVAPQPPMMVCPQCGCMIEPANMS